MTDMIQDYINEIMKRIKEDRIGAYAAQSAFFIIMSFIPFIMLLLSLVQFFAIDQTEMVRIVKEFLPDFLQMTALSVVEEFYDKSFGIISFAAVATIWSAAKAIQSVTYALNTVNQIEENRSWIRLRMEAMIHTVLFVVILMALLIFIVFGYDITQLIENVYVYNGPPFVLKMFMMFRYLIIFAGLVLVFALIYKTIPNRKCTFISQIPSGLACSIAWSVFSFALSMYVKWFNGFSMYGSLTTIVLTMLWLYVCMYIFLVCEEFNPAFLYFISLYRIKHPKKEQKRKGRQNKMQMKKK